MYESLKPFPKTLKTEMRAEGRPGDGWTGGKRPAMAGRYQMVKVLEANLYGAE